uniref:Secreted protein n=1 Tax=Setaria viridis TaxID=4556 RepID=A0A4U6SS05_SETVI|nr:hypothetical protein SEVIR_9G061150v2 [Setaria viridis]
MRLWRCGPPQCISILVPISSTMLLLPQEAVIQLATTTSPRLRDCSYGRGFICNVWHECLGLITAKSYVEYFKF